MKESDAHFRLSDGEFETQFACGTLNPALFNHEAHLRLAWLHIDKYGIERAIENICNQLASFVSASSLKDKYNKTFTIAAIRAIYHFKLQSRSKNFNDFILEFPELRYNFKQLVGFHYENNIFYSQHERSEYLEPELISVDV